MAGSPTARSNGSMAAAASIANTQTLQLCLSWRAEQSEKQMDPEFLSSDDEEFDVIFDDDDEELNDIELFQQRSSGTPIAARLISVIQ